MITALV